MISVNLPLDLVMWKSAVARRQYCPTLRKNEFGTHEETVIKTVAAEAKTYCKCILDDF